MQTAEGQRAPAHLAAVDSIRCLAALWVCFGHGMGPPLWRGVDPTGWQRYAAALYGNLFPGQAAVIVFFVVSGLCIHWPAARGQPLDTPAFLLRRLLRIGLPVLALVLLAEALLGSTQALVVGIYWSIYCEVIYYLLYPLLLPLSRRWGWPTLFGLATLGAWAVAATQPGAPVYPSFGVLGTALLGLPCWLLGAWIAETWRPPPAQPAPPWAWRLAVLAGMVAASVLHFHAGISYVWSLNLFAVLAGLWLRAETRYFAMRRPWRWLERAGLGSYSLYLVHLPTLIVLYSLVGDVDPWVGWVLQWAVVFAVAWLFHRTVERPAHSLARGLGRRMRQVRPAT